MTPERAERCVTEAMASPFGDANVHYPGWYLRHWHFLPEGYLSRRSAAGYDRVIRNVYNAWSEHRVLSMVTDRLRRQAPGAVIDIGAGPGRALERMASALPTARLVGVDLSPFNLERAGRRLGASAVELVHADALGTPFESESFDAVVAIHMFGHLPVDAAEAGWREAARLLAPGGRLYVVDHRWHPRHDTPLHPLAEAPILGGLLRFQTYTRLERAS